MKYIISTLGCKVNQYESQQMCEMLEAHGCIPAGADECADICIVNTCSVTSTADQKGRQTIGRMRRKHPGAIVCVTGCCAQGTPDKADLLAGDIVIGNSNRERLWELITQFIERREKIVCVEPHAADFSGAPVHGCGERTRALIKIEDGCNRFCSYCIIPYARGRVRSRPLEDIAAEAHILAHDFREVVLVGINLTAYGMCKAFDLADAVSTVAQVEGIKRIRLGSLEPDYLTDDLLDRLAACDKLCPHFHMSLQSGCTATLRRMNRHYTAEEYLDICRRLRQRWPDCSITTDVMVGFAGETDEEFEQSLTFVRSAGFAKVHCFTYSRRPGTVADRLEGHVPPEVSAPRSTQMLRAASESALAFNRSQIGKAAEILIEREISPGVWEGFSRNYTPYRISGSFERGQLVTVTANDACEQFCTGTTV